jgi:hypothetical protein
MRCPRLQAATDLQELGLEDAVPVEGIGKLRRAAVVNHDVWPVGNGDPLEKRGLPHEAARRVRLALKLRAKPHNYRYCA